MQVSSINAILKSKFNNVLSNAGNAQATVTGVFYNDKLDRYSVNLKAITPYHAKEIKRLIAPFRAILTGDQSVDIDLTHTDAADLQTAVGLGLYSMVRTTDYIPSKGELVKVQLGWVETKSGEEALLVTGITELAAQKATKMNFDSLFDEEPAESDFTSISEEVAA